MVVQKMWKTYNYIELHIKPLSISANEKKPLSRTEEQLAAGKQLDRLVGVVGVH